LRARRILHFHLMSLAPSMKSSGSSGPSRVPRDAAASLPRPLAEAEGLDRARDHAGAAVLLDEGLARHGGAPAPLRFRALVLRADLAVSLNDLIEARGILAEARQVAL